MKTMRPDGPATGRIFAVLLSAALLFTQPGAAAFAEEGQTSGTDYTKELEKNSAVLGTVSGNDLNKPGKMEQEDGQVIRITGFDDQGEEVQNRLVPAGTQWEDLKLPTALGAFGYTVSDGTEPVAASLTVEDVMWEIDPDNEANDGNSVYSPEIGSYCLTPVLPLGYELENGVALPEIYVMIEGTDNLTYDPNIYSRTDVEVINAIIENNGWSIAKDDPAGWKGADIVVWDSSTPKRITIINCLSSGLRGTLDVSACTNLRVLRCGGNPGLMGLTLGTVDLTRLSCQGTGFRGTLDVSGCNSLQYLDCYGNPHQTGLTLGQLANLTEIDCSDSGLKGTLDVSGCSSLQSIECSSNINQTGLALGGLKSLTRLYCNNTGIRGTLDVLSCSNLQVFYCHDSKINGTLDVSGCSSLYYLDCAGNPDLTEIIPGPNLADLDCSNTGISGTLNVSGCSSLHYLNCAGNPDLTEIIPGPNLAILDCSNTGISGTLDLSGCTRLSYLNCYGNPSLTGLMLELLTSLKGLDCSNTGLSGTLNLSRHTSLTHLTCFDNADLTGLDLSGCKLWYIDCNNILLTELKMQWGDFMTVNATTGGKVMTTCKTNSSGNEYNFVKLAAIPETGYLFQGWQVTGTTLADSKENPISFKMDGDITITPTFVRETLSGDNGSSDNDNPSVSPGPAASADAAVQSPPRQQPKIPANGIAQPLTPDKNGGVTVQEDVVFAAITAAKQAARRRGGTDNGIAVCVPINITDGQRVLKVIIPASTLDRLVKEKAARLELKADGMISYCLTGDALKQLDIHSAGGDIILRAEKQARLKGAARAAVGSRGAYDITMAYLKNGEEVAVSALNGSTITVRLPYTPKKGEDAGNLYAVGVDNAGKAEWLTKSAYDSGQKAVIFELSHFGIYGTGRKPAPNYIDTATHWAREDIDFVTGRGLFTGIGAAYRPDAAITGGMLVTALGRLSGIDSDSGKGITDRKTDACCLSCVNWAVEKGIVNGIGKEAFAPDQPVTRQEMAVIMQNYDKAFGGPASRSRETRTFTDGILIAGWAKDAVRAMQMAAGIINGRDEGRFDPAGPATRAEAAAMLHRYVERLIDMQTAQGLDVNDSSSVMLYEDGKAVKSASRIVDGVSFTFNENGEAVFPAPY